MGNWRIKMIDINRTRKRSPPLRKRHSQRLCELIVSTTFLVSHPSRTKPKTKNGFTLLELSIVLVIIGLIVGGILVGREMIRNSEIRSTISQFDKYATAINTFKLKYNCLPGDCSNGTDFGLTAVNGNGDGRIPGSFSTSPEYNEVYSFWYSLQSAGLIGEGLNNYAQSGSQTPTGRLPTMKMNPDAFIAAVTFDSVPVSYYSVLGNGLVTLGHCSGNVSALYNCNNNGTTGTSLTASDAYILDSKIDDGAPLSGVVSFVHLGPSLAYNIGYTAFTNGICVSRGLNQYNIQSTNAVAPYYFAPSVLTCNLMVRGKW
jgi:prepilin-type N-terminal cleavage/methylation domain-containing protein